MRPSMEANMAFSVNSPIGDGVTTQFAVSFTNGLYSRDNVHVFVGDETTERAFTWINDGLIDVQGTVPAVGEVVTIRRIMDKTNKAVDFADGEILDERNLDAMVDQLYNISHEFLDGYGLTEVNVDIDMRGNDIINVGAINTDSITLGGDTFTSQAALTGPQGPIGLTGPQGNQGTQGPQGIQGESGVDGSSFTVDTTGLAANRSSFDNEAEGFSYLATDVNELYIREGAVGNWSSPIVFGVGPQGPQGIQGIQGTIGPKGEQGLTGATGATGATGIAGNDGADGADGSIPTIANSTSVWSGSGQNLVNSGDITGGIIAGTYIVLASIGGVPDTYFTVNVPVVESGKLIYSQGVTSVVGSAMRTSHIVVGINNFQHQAYDVNPTANSTSLSTGYWIKEIWRVN